MLTFFLAWLKKESLDKFKVIQYDLAVAIRIYPGISKEPVFFQDSKPTMVENMLSSFLRGIGNLRVKFYFLLDHCPTEYQHLIKQTLVGHDFEIIEIEGKGGNLVTFERQIDLLLQQNDSENVMFVEDDYLYTRGAIEDSVRFLQNQGVDFVSPYDHMDYYTLSLHDHPVKVRFFEGRHWRQANSTTLTFLTTKRVLKETHRYFRTFSRKNWDCSIFWTLGKYHIFSLRSLAKFIFLAIKGDSFFLKIWLRTWYFTPLANVTSRRYQLWTPIPSGATHLQQGGLAPNVDWEKEITPARL